MTTAAMATYHTTKSTRSEQNSNAQVELREWRVQRGSGAACSQSPSAVCSAKTPMFAKDMLLLRFVFRATFAWPTPSAIVQISGCVGEDS